MPTRCPHSPRNCGLPPLALWLVAVLTTACAETVPDPTGSDAESHVVILEGEELEVELTTSPDNQVPYPFARIGVIWEADHPGAIEISTSADGVDWSPWVPFDVQHTEVELVSTFIGQLATDDLPEHFRIRGAEDREASFARLEFLPSSLSDAVEDGEDTEDSKADIIANADSFNIGGATVNSRSQWGARSSRCTRKIRNPYRMTIHHTESPTDDRLSPPARLRSVQRYHMDVRGWCDVGYHYLMSRDGRLWEGRPATLRGAHAGGSNNTGNLGIAVLGKHDRTPITDAQVSGVASLVKGLGDKHGIAVTRSNVEGHRDHKSTTCPGDTLYGQLGDVIAAAESSATPPPPPTEPDPEPDTQVGGVRVIGFVYVAGDPSRPIPGAVLQLGDRQTTSDERGLWKFDNVPERTFITVTGAAPGYQTGEVIRVTQGETWASFGLEPEGATTGNAILQGVVYHTSNSLNRIPFATVRLSNGVTTTTDGNGFYRVTGLPSGRVTITASASGWQSGSVVRTLVSGETEWGSVRLFEGSDTGQTDPDTGGGSGGGTGGGSDLEPFGDVSSQWSCPGVAGKTVSATGSYYTTSFGCWVDENGNNRGDSGDNCIPWCQSGAATQGRAAQWNALCGGLSGPTCERMLQWYVADADRYGCATRLRVTRPSNGKSVIVAVIDRGPSCTIENRVDHWVLDMSYPTSYYLFGEPKAATERGEVFVEMVPETTPLGPE